MTVWLRDSCYYNNIVLYWRACARMYLRGGGGSVCIRTSYYCVENSVKGTRWCSYVEGLTGRRRRQNVSQRQQKGDGKNGKFAYRYGHVYTQNVKNGFRRRALVFIIFIHGLHILLLLLPILLPQQMEFRILLCPVVPS